MDLDWIGFWMRERQGKRTMKVVWLNCISSSSIESESSSSIESSSSHFDFISFHHLFFILTYSHTQQFFYNWIRMSIMDILDPFTMKNVIIYEKGWKVCFRETSVVVFECKDVLFEPFVCHRQKWEERKLGEYEGERGEKPKQSKAKERAIRRSWCFWACFWRRRRRGFHFHYFDSLFFICVFVSWFVEIQFILFLKGKETKDETKDERKGKERREKDHLRKEKSSLHVVWFLSGETNKRRASIPPQTKDEKAK